MLWIIAVVIILIGLFLIISGLFEKVEYREEPIDEFEDYEERRYIKPQKEKKSKVTGGGVVLIGPIPIVFGESRFAVIALILAIVLMILTIGLMYLLPYYAHMV